MQRAGLVRRGIRLEVFTVGWNVAEAVVGLLAGLAAGSVALVGFALDSVVEASSGVVLLWRLRAEQTGTRSVERAERTAVRGVGAAFVALAVYVAARAVLDLIDAARPDPSIVGIVLAATSLFVMPALALRKKQAAAALESRALGADSVQTLLCALLSVALLLGLAVNAFWGWWWADPLAALVIAGLAAREGYELLAGKDED